MSPELFGFDRSVNVHPQLLEFDHALITCTLHNRPPPKEDKEHTCDGTCVKCPRFTWAPSEQARYAQQLLSISGRETLRGMISLPPDEAQEVFARTITAAAVECGMWRECCPLKPLHHNAKLPEWFNSTCKRAKQRLHQAIVEGDTHVSARLRKEYKAKLARRKKIWSRQAQLDFLNLLRGAPGEALKQFKKRATAIKIQSAVTMDKWHSHLQSHFVGQDQGELERPQQARVTTGDPGFRPPDLLKWCSLVKKQLSLMSCSSAPGIDGLTVPFLKYAFVPSDSGDAP
jgi:hypothetical protein